MTIQQLKEEYKIYFDTFWYVKTHYGHDKKMICKEGIVTQEGLKYFLEYIDTLKKAEDHRRKVDDVFFCIKEGKAICPKCGGIVYRGVEVKLPRHPIFTYYCTDCDYNIESCLVPKETKEDEKVIKQLLELYQKNENE